jgi:glycosyltransferase involved in cell wall biosynthesis
MKIAIATDAWHPQVNGVVRTLSTVADRLRRLGHRVEVIEPSRFWTVPCPTYREIRLALGCSHAVGGILDRTDPDAVHIATEGPVGHAARAWCLRRRRPFTTSFHTRFPDYVSVRSGVPASWVWAAMRRFHRAAERTFVCTPALEAELNARGVRATFLWPLGVDLDNFHPGVPPHPAMAGLPRPILLNVGRVAVEKNIGAFLDCQAEGSRVVVGDGPALAALKARYPEVLFLGVKRGPELASTYTAADVFVFPSRTDTFGLVNIEALACGLPVAAYPVPGPADILGPDECGMHGRTARIGALDEDLGKAIGRALTATRGAAIAEAAHYGWDRCVGRFLEGLAVRATAGPNLRAA